MKYLTKSGGSWRLHSKKPEKIGGEWISEGFQTLRKSTLIADLLKTPVGRD